MNNLLLLAGIIGFGPAFVLMWFSMRKYDWPYVKGACFDDRKVFLMLAIGMVLGTLLFTIERTAYNTFRTEDVDNIVINPLNFVLIYVVGMGLMYTFGKYILLNFPGFEGRPDSQFLGIALGAGISATWIVGFSYVTVIFKSTAEGFETPPDILDWLILILLSFDVALVNVSVGAMLGNGSIRKQGLRVIPAAIVPHVMLCALMLPWFMRLQWVTVLLALPISLLIYWEIYMHIIPDSLPEEIKKEIAQREKKEDGKARRRRR